MDGINKHLYCWQKRKSSKSEKHLKLIENELRVLIRGFDDLNRRYRLIQDRIMQENITTTVTTSKQSKFAEQSKHTSSSSRRRDRQPSESSVDSTVDVFDPELRQKYMRAVAYLRILDEAPIPEELDRPITISRTAESVDIDFELYCDAESRGLSIYIPRVLLSLFGTS